MAKLKQAGGMSIGLKGDTPKAPKSVKLQKKPEWKKIETRKSRSLPKAEPYYDIKTKSTKYSTKGDVKTLKLPKKAKK